MAGGAGQWTTQECMEAQMRKASRRWYASGSSISVLTLIAFGCSTTPVPSRDLAKRLPAAQPAEVKAAETHTVSKKKKVVPQPAGLETDADSTNVGALTAQVEAQAQRLTEAMTQTRDGRDESALTTGSVSATEATPPALAQRVEWIEKPRAHVAVAPPSVANDTTHTEANHADSMTIADTAAQPAVIQPVLDRQALLENLLKDIRTSQDHAMAKAVSAAALALVDSDHKLDEADLAPLSPTQRDQVQRYHRTIMLLGKKLASGDQSLSPSEVSDQLTAILGESSLHMSNIQLCRKVSGFGVYDTFESNTFLAGREQPMIVYAELENFRSTQDVRGQYQVKLTQEIVLYNESDGLAVWKQPTAEIVDRSRNRRRDFFVVQLIRLPARLSVGKYRLKIRVNDVVGGSIDESSVQIQIVAGESLVSNRSR